MTSKLGTFFKRVAKMGLFAAAAILLALILDAVLLGDEDDRPDDAGEA